MATYAWFWVVNAWIDEITDYNCITRIDEINKSINANEGGLIEACYLVTKLHDEGYEVALTHQKRRMT